MVGQVTPADNANILIKYYCNIPGSPIVFCLVYGWRFVSPEYNADITIQIISGIHNEIIQEGSPVFLHSLHRGGGRRGGRGGRGDRAGECFGCKRSQSRVPIGQSRIDSQCSDHSRIWSSCHQNPGNCLVPHNLYFNLSSMFWMTYMFKVPTFSSLYQSFTSLTVCGADCKYFNWLDNFSLYGDTICHLITSCHGQ